MDYGWSGPPAVGPLTTRYCADPTFDPQTASHLTGPSTGRALRPGALPPVPLDYARHAIRNRLLLSVGLSVMLGVSMTAFVFVVASGTIRSLADKTATLEAMEDAFHAQEVALYTQETFAFDYALSGREEAIEEFDARDGGGPPGLYPSSRWPPGRSPTYSRPPRRCTSPPIDVARGVGRAVHPLGRGRRADDGAGDRRGQRGPVPARRGGAAGPRRGPDRAARSVTAAEVAAAVPDLAFVIVPFGAVVTLILLLIGVWLDAHDQRTARPPESDGRGAGRGRTRLVHGRASR